MRIGMCTSIAALADAGAAGYDYAELPLAFSIGVASAEEYAHMRAAIQAAPLPVEAFNCLLPSEVKVTGPAADLEAMQAVYWTLPCRVPRRWAPR